MKRCANLIVLFLMGFVFSQCTTPTFASLPEGAFYIAPSGNDANPGTIDQPFASWPRAQQAVRDLVAAGLTQNVVVYFRQGKYYLSSTMTINASDSGTSSCSITYAAYPGEEVRIIGGIPLQPDWFTPVTDSAIIARLPAGMAPNVLEADLPSHGITNYGTLRLRGFRWDYASGAMELFFDGKAMTLARWPNSGWQSIAGIPAGRYDRKFTYSGSQPDRWTTAPDAWVWGDFSVYWADAILFINSIDPATKTITLGHIGYDGIAYSYGFTPIWHAMNLLEEIDSPGEWYLSRTTGKLYWYPPEPLAGHDLYVSLIDTLFTCQNARHIQFEGLILECTRDILVKLDNSCDHIRFYQCAFRNAGTFAASIYGTQNGLDSCAVYDTGDGGVILKGGTNQNYLLTLANNYVQNTHIHNLNRWAKTAKPGIWSDGDAGLTVSHNLIHDLPAIAYSFMRCNELTITYNDIYNVCQIVDDNGALYCEWDWTCRSNDIMYNFIHNMTSAVPAASGVGIPGVYLDYGASGQNIKYNIFYQIPGGRAVFIGGGRDSVIENNIIANCYSGIFIDRRINDTIYYSDYYTRMVNKLNEFLTANPDYLTYGSDYATLGTILSDSPKEPMHNQVKRNLATGYSPSSWLESGSLGGYIPTAVSFLEQQDNLAGKTLDPKFVDPANLDMNLQPTSPAYSIPGWQDIPFDQIGLAPAAPQLYLARNAYSAFTLVGSCEPWAILDSAILQPAGLDVSAYLTIKPNGAISGQIPRELVPLSSETVTVEITTKDPKNHFSPLAVSNACNTLLAEDFNQDGLLDILDLQIFFSHWLHPCAAPETCEGTDLNNDQIVNLEDFADFAAWWE